MKPTLIRTGLALLITAALLLGLWVGRAYFTTTPIPPPTLETATLLPMGKALTAFQLGDHKGRAFGLDQLRQGWSFIFFGYTHCPDVCPTTLSQLNLVEQELAKQPPFRKDVAFVFISVDPARDTPQHLAKFVPFFNPAFLGVTGETAQIDNLARQLGVIYMRSDAGQEEKDENYLIDHSAGIALINPEGRFYAYYSAPRDPAAMARDFIQIRRYYEQQ